MDYCTYADAMRAEAQSIIDDKTIFGPLLEHGKLHLTGSCFLDVVAKPDIDIYFEANDKKQVLDLFSRVASQCMAHPKVKAVLLEKELYKRYVFAPRGVYLKIKVQQTPEHLWQIDLWDFEDVGYMKEKLAESAEFKKKITLEKRALILQLKHDLIKQYGKTPSFSSYFLYQAVLDHGMTEYETVKEYLQKSGIVLPIK